MESMASQTVQNQTTSSEVVVSALDNHKEAVAEQLFKTQKSSPSKRLTQAEIETWLDWLGSELSAYGDDLWTLELAYTQEQSDDPPVVSARDQAGNLLEDALRATRNSAQEICGASSLDIYGLSTPPPGDLSGRKKYAENTLKLLRKHSAPITKFGQTFDPIAIASSIEVILDAYMSALAEDADEDRQLEGAKGERDRGMEEWKIGYHSIAGQVEGLFRQARRPYLAERVRPTAKQIRGDEAAPAITDPPKPAAPAAPDAATLEAAVSEADEA